MSERTLLSERDFDSLLRRARQAGIYIELHDDPECRTLVVPSRRHIVVAMRASLGERYHMLCAALRELHQAELVARDPWAAVVARNMPVTTVTRIGARDEARHDARDPDSADSLAISIDICLEDAQLDATHETGPPERMSGPTLRVDLAPIAAMQANQGASRALGDAIYEDPATLRDVTAKMAAQAVAEHLAAAATAAQTSRATHGCELCRAPLYGTLGPMLLCRNHLYASVAGRLLPDEVRALRARHPDHPEVGAARYDEEGEIRRGGR